MTEILTDFSTPALIHAVKSNLYEFFRYLGRAKQTELFTSPPLIRWHTPVPHPWFNGVLSTQPAAEADQHAVQDVIAYFQSRSAPSFTWWLAPTLGRADWERQLLQHGFRFDDNTPGLAMDLRMLNQARTALPDLEITPVLDLPTLKVWTHTFITGYQAPDSWESSLLELLTGLGLDWPIGNYLGILNGKPVAASGVFLGAGVAGVYNVATLPEVRGKGIGAAMTLAPLHQVRQLGYRIGILQSSEMGFNLYQQLGFRRVCQMEHFYWSSDSSIK